VQRVCGMMNQSQTHFLNVWPCKPPSPEWLYVEQIVTTIHHFFDPTFSDPHGPYEHFSKKYFLAKNVLFVRYLSLKSSKSFHTDIIQERAAGYGETPRTRIPGAPPTHHAHPRTTHTHAPRTPTHHAPRTRTPLVFASPFHPYYYTQRTHMRCARTSPGGTHRTHMRHAGTSPGGPRHGPPSPLPYLPCHLTRAPVASKVRVWGRCRLCHTVCLAATRDAAECHA